jgi:hypothetical protein
MRFAERFFQLFHYGLLASSDLEPIEDWAEVEKKARELTSLEEGLALPTGYAPADREAAIKPVLLWLDERMQNSPQGDGSQWRELSFQRRLWETNLGGELFFQDLADLLTRRAGLLGFPASGAAWPIRALALDQFGQLEPTGQNQSWDWAGLWVEPGAGPDPLEGILDCYALSLALGYQGRYYQGDPELETLRGLARAQLSAWRPPEPPAPPKPKPRWREIGAWLWKDYWWVLIHLLLPGAALFLLWLRRANILASLTF